MYESFAFVDMHASCDVRCLQRPEEGVGSSELELQVVMTKSSWAISFCKALTPISLRQSLTDWSRSGYGIEDDLELLIHLPRAGS